MIDIAESRPLCPYCTDPILELSKDHIFPQFLGGRRRVNCCKTCNSVFGHTFEAGAAKVLQAEHVYISSWGLPLRSADPTWKAAHEHDGKTYDLSVGETSVRPKLSKPVIQYDEEGNVVSGEFADKKQGDRFARGLIEKGKAKRVEIEHVPPASVNLMGLGNTIVLGPDLRRLALKMCVALSTLLPAFDVEEVAEARLFLRNNPASGRVMNTYPAYDVYDDIDSRREALCHVIYVERSQTRVYGVVQFFGVIQIFCRLGIYGSRSQTAALFASLDPVTGDERFSEVAPLDLAYPPYFIRREEYPRLMEGWMKKFRDEAIKRGAPNPPEVEITSIEIEGHGSVLKKSPEDG